MPFSPQKWGSGTNTGFGDDGRPYWQRLYGIGRPWNQQAFDNYATLVAIVVGAIVVLFALLYAAS